MLKPVFCSPAPQTPCSANLQTPGNLSFAEALAEGTSTVVILYRSEKVGLGKGDGNMMSNFMNPDVLKYGALGLGLALAVLTFQLLRAEQNIAKPRLRVLAAIYLYMAFSLLLSASGFVSEFLQKRLINPCPAPGPVIASRSWEHIVLSKIGGARVAEWLTQKGRKASDVIVTYDGAKDDYHVWWTGVDAGVRYSYQYGSPSDLLDGATTVYFLSNDTSTVFSGIGGAGNQAVPIYFTLH